MNVTTTAPNIRSKPENQMKDAFDFKFLNSNVVEKEEQGQEERAALINGVKVYRRSSAELEKLDMTIAAIWQSKPLYYKFIKRAFDIVASLVALVCLSPLFFITAIAIAIEDGFPVFFSQMRTGANMKAFRFYKFRSMYKDAPRQLKDLMKNNEQSGPAFKIKNDPRITKVGHFIRHYSIDELPQLVNIIKGDMSIVGPRPILDFQMEACDEYDCQRMCVRPGLTCYWQISGRANISWEKWVELDLQYVRDMSILTDLKLILKTIPVIFKGAGAY
ncbi:sugar transferase [Butyrivibrio sp. NC3005]|uniref:sugar transferase n=1 Tax=Butyrivibrio sp. NC3005 TaxID=1280685 RepID=UPI00042342ED|nr:sugar transferase [Butyrivibrio sp. NC3005]